MFYYFFNKINKDLKVGISKSGSKNFLGRITVRGQGGGNKRVYRFIDFIRRINKFCKVLKVIYDPLRTSRLCLVLYTNSLCSYLLLHKGVKMGSVLYSGSYPDADNDTTLKIKAGYSLPLKYMPLFSNISNIELKPFKGSQLCRAASASCMIIGKTLNKSILKLKSGWELHLSQNCISTYNPISSKHINNMFIKKAGKLRALGWRPKVRGVAQNPCDHPHGGGNGKKPKPKVPVNAWHTVFKWKPTCYKKADIEKRRIFKKVKFKSK